MTPNAEELLLRAEFYLCLSRAFMAPDQETLWAGMRMDLAADLADLDENIGYGIADHMENYRKAIAAIPDGQAALQLYSSLFITPPRLVSINAGMYLDGAINGGSVLAMEDAYRRCGLARSEEFRDLSDHVAIQLEFVAYCFAASAGGGPEQTPQDAGGRFLDAFIVRWLPAFIADLGRDDAGRNPWLHLALALQQAAARDACAAPAAPPAIARQQAALVKARHNRAHQDIAAEDMAFIAKCLEEKGLAIDHLAIPPERRDESHGWSRKVPPSPRRGSRLG